MTSQAEPECCGSNEKRCHAHGHLTSWLPECGSLWGGLGGIAEGNVPLGPPVIMPITCCHGSLLS